MPTPRTVTETLSRELLTNTCNYGLLLDFRLRLNLFDPKYEKLQ